MTAACHPPAQIPPQLSRVVSLGARARPPEPAVSEETRVHQAFLGRVIDFLCADAGVTQFVDWGCPVPGTAERVRAARADARFVHVAPQGTAGMLSSSGTAVITADGSGDGALTRRLSTSGLVDFDEPVAVLMTRPFTADDPPADVGALHALMRGGGFLALASTAPRRTVERAFRPFHPIEPGVADLTWWPYPDEDVSARGTGILGGLGRRLR
ncbi:SAM-dependent methyltransferase [Nocardiopsis sp. NRRL B-16309]|uniref:SAM-dependent methyltransferase n=1 Tax=Nocardiopsis sp. NRRL B-16309 TaxID=1519494 RepID=UPI0006AE93ED|nr:SAM-dependent methyltransferase [Nocardiopsis sp. NRRL B-16309]KOX07297.1 SAM-dependent methyltransferase [Nocardiopsis sp. NRRL B-16309]